MESKQSHLIERAAARLAETQAVLPQSTFVLDMPSRIARDAPAAQSSAQPETALGIAAANGRAPQIDAASLAKAGLIRQSNSRVAEELRIIQNRVLRQSFRDNAAASGSANLVMITSALKGEGKTFISINLAGEIARHGDRRVLLVDTDAKPDPVLFGHVRLTIDHSALNLGSTAHRVQHAREFCQQAVAGVLDDAPPILLDLRINQLAEMPL